MSHSVSVTIEAGIAAQSNELGLIICKSCNEVIATQPTDGYKKVLCGVPSMRMQRKQ